MDKTSEDMIEIAKDYEHGFERTRMRRFVGRAGMSCIVEGKDVSAKLIILPDVVNLYNQ